MKISNGILRRGGVGTSRDAGGDGRRVVDWQGLTPLLAIGVLIALFSILRPTTFFTPGTFFSILNTQAVLAIVAIGLTVVLLTGEFDLSVGFIVTFTGILAAGLVARQSLPVWLAVVIALSVGAAIGVVSGVLVAVLKVPALVATLAVGTMVEGLMLWYSNGEVIFEGLPAAFIELGRWQWGPVRAPAVYLVVIAITVWLVLKYTPAGRYLHAIGGNRNAARISGVRVNRYVILAFALSGLLAAIGGVVLAARNGSANPSAGTPFLLPAFAAAFLGSVTLRKGEFHVVGTIVGVYLIAVGSTGFVILGAPFFTQQLFSGAVLIFATAGSRFVQRRKTARVRDVPAMPPGLSET